MKLYSKYVGTSGLVRIYTNGKRFFEIYQDWLGMWRAYECDEYGFALDNPAKAHSLKFKDIRNWVLNILG